MLEAEKDGRYFNWINRLYRNIKIKLINFGINYNKREKP